MSDIETEAQSTENISDPVAGQHCVVHKFGGTSLADGEAFQRVAKILRQQTENNQWVVVSAAAGVTDTLTALANAAVKGETYREQWRELRQRHTRLSENLFTTEQTLIAISWLNHRFDQLAAQLHAVHTLQTLPPQALARIQGCGEQSAAYLLSQLLSQNGTEYPWLDASEALRVHHGEMGAQVDWAGSRMRLQHWRQQHPSARKVVVTGFLASLADGSPTTLGRNGSDYSATIFGRLLAADEVQLWTDVDGVLSADPRLVPEAVVLPSLSYHEACELAYFGARVIHPQSLSPVMESAIPVRIRNTFNPRHPGSLISEHSTGRHPVRGISSVGGLALLNVEGAGMIGVPGTAQRVFGALQHAGVSVVMISQGSSEHSICCVVEQAQAETGRIALLEAFSRELATGLLNSISIEPRISVLAAVGDRMAGAHGIAARLFHALAHSQINVRAIAQGASERNISVAVGEDEAQKALRAIHAGFWLSPKTVSVGVIGPGNVGAELLNQLQQTLPHLTRERGLDFRVRAIANSRQMLLAERAVNLNTWTEDIQHQAEAMDIAAFTAHVQVSHLPNAVIIDCSASDAVAQYYQHWLQAGIHVITPNKHAGSGPLPRYRDIQQTTRETGSRFLYETTVGAGLPIIQTLRDLLDTGDEILTIEGIFSGTLAWLFNRYDGTAPFSQLVRQAFEQGYTEPDPRDDLDGRDVARKLVILAREIGHDLDLDQVTVESLVPPPLSTTTEFKAEEFLDQLPQWDSDMKQRLEQAREQNDVLRYVARLHRDGRAEVGLRRFPRNHDFARLRLTDNIVQFTTRRYRENPLVVQGPGAGREVTAAGVFADLLRVSVSSGGRS